MYSYFIFRSSFCSNIIILFSDKSLIFLWKLNSFKLFLYESSFPKIIKADFLLGYNLFNFSINKTILYLCDKLNNSKFISIYNIGYLDIKYENKNEYIFSNDISLLHINIVLLIG